MKNVLNVRIDAETLETALKKVRAFLTSSQHRIYTPNPEMLVKARQDKYFREVLNAGDLNLCDGFGLSVFAKTKRLPGADFMVEICRLASELGVGIYLLGSGSDAVVRKTSDELRKRFPTLKIAGYDRGPDIHESKEVGYKLRIDEVNNQTVIERLNVSNPEIIFVAFGMGKQEKWIHENLYKMPSVKIAMGVGGAFDYIAGIVPRAPLFLRKIGLEWLYRVIRQPSRLGRIWNATAVFTYLALKEKYDHKN